MTNDTSRNSDASGEATVRKVYVKDLKDRERIHTVFRVTRKELVTARSGKTFLSLTFTDRTGHVDGRVFEKAEALHPTFLVDDYVLVAGNVTTFRGQPQVVAENIERLEPGPIDASEFTPPPDAPRPGAPERPAKEKAPAKEKPPARERGANAAPRPDATALKDVVEGLLEGPIRAVLLALLEDGRVSEGLRRGGKGNRPSTAGVVEGQLQLVRAVAPSYPQVNEELLVAGVVLAGVARALEVGDEARLVGGPVLAAQKLHEKTRQAEVPHALAHQLAHLVLALEDPREGTAARRALTLEAEVVRTLVGLDLRLQQWTEQLERGGEGHWSRPLEDGRTLLRTGSAPREKKPRKERKPKGEKATGQEAQPEPLRPPRPTRDLPSELSFKPFSALTALAPEGGTQEEKSAVAQGTPPAAEAPVRDEKPSGSEGASSDPTN
ncbi:MAG TPA: OB-fold nucleic acid binding domain-containing protein [Myxococcaceae bacterium]|nr:OB-fold nucleic acid binding domain-containing protein [Myxococcaceae bacterium]